jgi:hypothetical protein
MYARLLLAVIVVVAVFAFFARPLGGAGLSVTRFERVRSAALGGAIVNEAPDAERVSLAPPRVDPDRMQMHLMRMDGVWVAYAAVVRMVYPVKRAIDGLDDPTELPPTAGRWSGCWWVLLFTGQSPCDARA